MEVKPGYKQTEVGVIPEEWEVKSLGEIGEALVGLTYKPSDVRDYGTLVLRSSNIQNDALAFEDNVFVDTSIPERIRVQMDDVLICVRNGSRDLIGKSALLDERTKGMTFGAFMAVYRSQIGKLASYLFQSAILKRQINEHLGATINQITNKSLNSFRIPVPPSDQEQRDIAMALSDVDGLLGGLDRLIAKKRDLKQAAMQQLLTGQTRLPGFHGEWAETTLGNIGNFKNGLNKDSSAFGHGSPFVNLMDVFGVNAISSTSHLGLVASTKMDREVYDLRQGDVLFIRSSVKPSGVGLTAVVERDLTDTVYSGFLIRFRDEEALDSGFKKHCFYEESFRKKIIAASSVSANTNINQNALGTLTLLLPPTKDEQTAIAEVLTEMDAELAALEQRREKTRALKQAMMQELLTGRTRLASAGGSHA